MNDTICYSLISVLRLNKSVTCRCQHTTVGYLTEDKKSKSKKGHNSLPNDRFLDWSKFKAIADDKINVA